jgi:hypothetical protein
MVLSATTVRQSATESAVREGDSAGPIYERAIVRGLVLTIAVLVAFGAALDGELVWDDPAVVGVAARLSSPLGAFSTDLFGLGGEGASYFRPLVTFAYAVDLRFFPGAPEIGLHLSNLLWHALTTWLVWRALERWTRASTPRGRLACWLVALVWAVLPAKAENVAWISGRADPMGLGLLLAALELRRRFAHPFARAATAAAGVLFALLCKESFVVAPALVALDVHGEGTPIGRAMRSPDALVCWAMSAAYLVVRALVLPLHGGGTAMFAGLSPTDRLLLALETIGHALRALVLAHESHVLRGPIGFRAPFVLRSEPWMAILGAAGFLAIAVTSVRSRRYRAPLLALLVLLLPIANLVPSGLESRMNDRFLYVPSVATAVALALLLERVPPHRFRVAATSLGAAGAILLALSIRRSALFASSDTLWSWERLHGDRAASVLENAARADERAGRLTEARDGYLETAARYEELGFAEGFPFVMRALHAEWKGPSASDPVFGAAYRQLLDALLESKPAPITIPLHGRAPITLTTGAIQARAFAQERREILIAWAAEARGP